MSNYSTRLLQHNEGKEIVNNNEFNISDKIYNSLSEKQKKDFRYIYTEILRGLEEDRFLHPQMEKANKLITPEGKDGKLIRREWHKTIAHNSAWIAIGL